VANHRRLVAGGSVANIAAALDFIAKIVQFETKSAVERYELHDRKIVAAA
jgi:hypothetical protein